MLKNIIVLLSICFVGLNSAQIKTDNQWEFLVYTQHWPPTVCLDWENKSPSHKCDFPKLSEAWTIHGIWPSHSGSMGPAFCNRTWLFDPEEIKPIESELEQSWTNIEADTVIYDLWAHEWNKHGTCAASIQPLNSQVKYFSKGIELLKSYSMSDILQKANVLPNNDKYYSVKDFHDAIKNNLGIVPRIECKYELHNQYLFELRICLNKSLDLIDCTHSHSCHKNTVECYNTNCNLNKGIIYPSYPNTILVKLYDLITWLQWLTL